MRHCAARDVIMQKGFGVLASNKAGLLDITYSAYFFGGVLLKSWCGSEA